MGALGLAVTGVGGLILLMALAGCGFCIHAGGALRRYAPANVEASVEAPANGPAITLIKPLHGAEPDLFEMLITFLAQRYPAAVELRMGVQSPEDAALPVARAINAAPNRAVRVVLDDTQHGANRKVSNLINIAGAAPLAPLVVQSDSDISVGGGYLASLAQVLSDPAVGVASCLYWGEAATPPSPNWSVAKPPALAAQLGAMGVSYQSLPLFAVGVSMGATPCMGSTIALRRETLEAIGGFESVKDVLADDYEIGAKVRALGLQSVVPPFLVAHQSTEATLGELWRHEVRWSKTVRDIDRWGHLGSVVTHPFPLAILGWTILTLAGSNLSGIGSAFALVALATRLWLKSRVDGVTTANGAPAATGAWWLLPARDMLSFAVFVGAFFARRVEWRGARFHVGRDGGLTPV